MEVLDQSQPVSNTGGASMMGTDAAPIPVGQTFTPQATPLTRMDFMIYSGYDYTHQPLVLKVWQWNTDYATTVAQTPIFQDTISLPANNNMDLYSVFPNNVAVTPGALYYLEFNTLPGGGRFMGGWGGANATSDPYPNGQLRTNGAFRVNQDLYFKTYTTPQGTPTPPTFASSDPALPWTAPPAPGAIPTATEYLNTITAFESRYCTGYYKTTPSLFNAAMAVYDAFLWKATNSTARANDAITMFELTYTYLQANPTSHLSQIEDAQYAWLWLKNYPGLTQTNRDHMGWMFVDAARAWWPSRAGGVQNQSFACMVTLKFCLNEFPAVLTPQEITDWTAYCDTYWNEWETRWDLEEDSAHYSLFTSRLLLQLVELYGEDTTIWQQPGFKAYIDKLYAHVMPLGAIPPAGACYGWAHTWATPVWIFEKAAAKYNDARYRWAAYRFYDYHRQYYKNDAYWYGAQYGEFAMLCHAYFDMNGALIPSEPVQAEVLAARQDQNDGASGWLFSSTNLLGQTFKPTATPLTRLDLQVARWASSTAPGTLTLWKWNTDLATTRAQTPLYRDSIDLTDCYNAWRLRSFYPFLDVEVGATYYMEFSRTVDPFETFSVRSSVNTYDYYPDGKLIINNAWRDTWDLWFKTYTLSKEHSAVTTRQGVQVNVYNMRYGTPPRMFEFTNEIVPDKLLLKSGNNPDSFTMGVNLCVNPYGHGHQEGTAILGITNKGALIYSDGSYADDDDIDHDTPVLRRYAGGVAGTLPHRTYVNHFVDYRKATVAWIGYSDFAGWDIAHERRFFFVKDRFALVRDHATASTAVTAALGNVWHARDVHPDHGDNWFDLYTREPWSLNNWKYKNPQQSLLLYFVPRTGSEVAEWLEASYPQTNPPANPPFPAYVMYQKRQLSFTAGQSVWADSVLLPHGPELTPTQAASNISVLYDDGQAVAIQVTVGDEIWTVVDNPAHTSITITGLSTDARYLITRSKPNTADYILADQATTVTVGSISKSWPTETTVEIGGY
jgi:hypothetical protein